MTLCGEELFFAEINEKLMGSEHGEDQTKDENRRENISPAIHLGFTWICSACLTKRSYTREAVSVIDKETSFPVTDA